MRSLFFPHLRALVFRETHSRFFRAACFRLLHGGVLPDNLGFRQQARSLSILRSDPLASCHTILRHDSQSCILLGVRLTSSLNICLFTSCLKYLLWCFLLGARKSTESQRVYRHWSRSFRMLAFLHQSRPCTPPLPRGYSHAILGLCTILSHNEYSVLPAGSGTHYRRAKPQYVCAMVRACGLPVRLRCATAPHMGIGSISDCASQTLGPLALLHYSTRVKRHTQSCSV